MSSVFIRYFGSVVLTGTLAGDGLFKSLSSANKSIEVEAGFGSGPGCISPCFPLLMSGEL